MSVLREIETGDPRPRVFIEIEAAVSPAETVGGEVETLHDWIVERLRDWYGPNVGLAVATYAEPERELAEI